MRDERGFTLVELLVAVAILGMVMSPIAASFVVGLRTSSAASQRMTDSRAAQITAAYFARDMQGATAVVSGDPKGCGVAAGNTAVVTLESDDNTDPPAVASYQVVPLDGTKVLVRTRCDGTRATNTAVLAHGIGATPTLKCTPGCGLGVWSATLHVAQQSGYSYDVRGSRRAG